MLQVPAQTDGPHPLHVTGKQVLQLGPVSAVPSMCERAARCPSLHWTPPVQQGAVPLTASACIQVLHGAHL